jgi:hypothetical protein
MSESVYDAVVGVLGPLVGKPLAQICISSAAIKIGKSSEALTTTDLDAVLAEVKNSMGAFTSEDLLKQAVEDIRGRVAA